MNNKFIFICGLHRSGTSLLHKVLSTHPEISGFSKTGVKEDEGQHLQSVFPAANRFGGPGKFGFDRRAYLSEASYLLTGDNIEKLRQEWSKYWDLQIPYLIEKSPPNIVRSRFLQKAFPNSYFIFLKRNPIAVAEATLKWSKSDILDLIDHTITCYEIFNQDKEHLNNVIEISYEEFCKNPAVELSKICDFLHIKPLFDKELVRGIKPNVNRKYFKSFSLKYEGFDKSNNDYFNYLNKRAKSFDYGLEKRHKKRGWNKNVKALFLLSHMRGMTSVISHILGSNPEIIGYSEKHKSYKNFSDLNLDTVQGNQMYVFDKILHNGLQVAPELIESENVTLLMSVRKPIESIASMLRMGNELQNTLPWLKDEKKVVNYYVNRLDFLKGIFNRYSEKILFFKAEELENDTQHLLDKISSYLELKTPLTSEYQKFEHTGKPGHGDSSGFILSGNIVKGRAHSPISLNSSLKKVAENKYQEFLLSINE